MAKMGKDVGITIRKD
jgi:hypothetical protein